MPLVLTGPQPTPTEYRPPYVNFPPRATPYSAGPRRFLDQLRFRNLFCHRHDLRQSYISGRLRTHFLLFFAVSNVTSDRHTGNISPEITLVSGYCSMWRAAAVLYGFKSVSGLLG